MLATKGVLCYFREVGLGKPAELHRIGLVLEEEMRKTTRTGRQYRCYRPTKN